MLNTIVMACDNHYAKYAYVTTKSLIDWNMDLQIYILVPTEFDEKNVELLISLSKSEQKNIRIVCKKVDYAFQCGIEDKHLNKIALFRLLIPNLIMDDRCLYLDVDTIVLGDLSELFNMDIEEVYVAGVKQIGVRSFGEAQKRDFCRDWEIADIDKYINSGVLLMNLKKIREENIVSKFLKLDATGRDWPGADQHIINCACYPKIGFFSPKYNVRVYDLINNRKMKKIFSENELEESYSNPVIIHYATLKPWNIINNHWAKIWWDVAKRTPIYNQFCTELVEEMLVPHFYVRPAFLSLTAFLDYLEGQSVIIYGAGTFGKKCLEILKSRRMRPVCFAVTSMENNESEIETVEVKEIQELSLYAKTCTVVIAVDTDKVSEMEEMLRQIGFHYYVLQKEWIRAFDFPEEVL